MVFAVSLLIGLLAAALGSLVGLGGGIILVPSLLILSAFWDDFSWATPQAIVGVSVIFMIFASVSSTLTYMKSNRVDYKSGFIFLAGGVPGAIIGSLLNRYVSGDGFSLYFGILVLIVFFMFFVKRKEKEVVNPKGIIIKKELEGATYTYSFHFMVAFVLSLFVGLLSGMFGIGGGSFMVPAMILLFGFPAQIAVATSMFTIFFLSLISAVTHISLGHVEWSYVWAFIPGAILGGIIGARVGQLLNGKTLVWILRIMLVLVAVRLIWDGLS
ncbi:sulfite exporter TauE/SafE family protein [Terribacillus saccharophilus]|uniref:sulfite exporter TauE/SafE family protein n=1 Tax=Terribacillus saccharophilus TaxID=361277 RepID=UPI0039827BD0